MRGNLGRETFGLGSTAGADLGQPACRSHPNPGKRLLAHDLFDDLVLIDAILPGSRRDVASIDWLEIESRAIRSPGCQRRAEPIRVVSVRRVHLEVSAP